MTPIDDCWDALTNEQLSTTLEAAFTTAAPKSILDRPPSAPVPICLEAVLPNPAAHAPADLLPEVSAIAWFQLPDWHQHCKAAPTVPPFALPDGLQIPEVSYSALMCPALETDPVTWTWEIYADGSQGMVNAGWSVVIVCSDQYASCFCGCYAGQVQLSPERPQWIGATEADNIAAEFTAFAMAQDIVLRLLPQRPTVIRPDLMLSQMIATFDSITTASPRLAQICRVLSTWLGPQIAVKQISAHKGHPWNELADALLPGRFHGFTNWQPPFMICTGVGSKTHQTVFDRVFPQQYRMRLCNSLCRTFRSLSCQLSHAMISTGSRLLLPVFPPMFWRLTTLSIRMK